MAKTVFVLGAGASKAGGAPLMGEFLDRARDLWARGDVPDDAASFEKVFKIIGALQIANSKSRLDLANIEALFNTFEMARLLGVFPLPGLTTTAEQAIDALRTVVAATLEATTNFQFAEGGLIPPSPYPDFVKLLVHLSGKAVPPHTVAVLTFNYDLGLDYALSRAGVSTDYCLGFAGPSTVPLLKLHGSLNWAVTDDTAERVLPWEMRDFTNRLSSQLVGRGVGPVKLSPRRSFAMFPDQPGPFKSGPFIPPAPPTNESDELRTELKILREAYLESGAANREAQQRLARRLRPFMLRRLKKEVAADLPAKIEQISFCELTPDQRSVYQQVIEASRKEVLEAVGAQGIAKSRMVVLTALLRLRQVCCDLRLLKLEKRSDGMIKRGDDVETLKQPGDSGIVSLSSPKGGEGRGEEVNDLRIKTPSPQPSPRLGGEREKAATLSASSGKLELFGELLEEVIDGGHRLLVFSQFVGMLTLLKEKLTADGIEFCYLDGSTTDRAAVVEKFQTQSAIPVFLISLKAGGVGLNLTGADTVIHFDPWWNPAVEDQATDRAHRIGQTRVVTSYKLITRDTVEEKILTLQNRKREIIQATIGGEEEFAAALNWEEIQELLA